ncbi:uncharacterized protein LOC131597746 [Vicia villosa]|uniref:uncharacterized protein LOC131597746 n=1 Tax=Vicia villosa TaxID=3911 RepID=UPI00273C0019|nr:uncharacterized protein LOC131597746 [Vicia villosa]
MFLLAANASDVQKTTHNEAKKKDCKAAYCIQTAVDSTNFDIISHAESTKEAWDILVKYCEGESNQLETLKLEDSVGSLEAHEIRIFKRKGVQDSIKALKAQSWKKNGGSNKFKGKVDKTQGKKPWSNPRKQQAKDRTFESSKRGGGNYQKEKTDKKGVKKDNGLIKGKDEGVNLACKDSDDYEGMVVMVAIAYNHIESKIWFLDSGCSNHMTGQKVWLAGFDESKKSKVKIADNNLLQAEGTGNIVFQMSNGGKAMIKDILYVPGIKCNLLSVGQLVEKGFSVVMKDGVLKLFNTQNNLVLKSLLSKNWMFKTMISSTEVQCLKIVVDHKDSWLWNLWFGHLNF